MRQSPPQRPPLADDHNYITDDDTNVYIEDSSLSSKDDDYESSTVTNRDLILESTSALRPSKANARRRHDVSEPMVFPTSSYAATNPSKSWHRTVILIVILMVAALAAGLTLPLLLLKNDQATNVSSTIIRRPTSSGAGNDVNGTTEATQASNPTEPPLSLEDSDPLDDDGKINATEPVNATDQAVSPSLEPTTSLFRKSSAPVSTDSNTTTAPTATTAKPSTAKPILESMPMSMSPSLNPTIRPQPTTPPTTLWSSQLLPLVRSVSVVPENLENMTTPEGKALAWMRTTDQFVVSTATTTRTIQRYAISTMVYGLNMFTAVDGIILDPNTDECAWEGISCNENNVIVAIQWPGRQRLGRLPDDMGLLSSLTMLDLAENMIVGEIPSGLFFLRQLEYLYLQNNLLSGKLSTKIGELVTLRKIFLGSNRFTGTIPRELGTLDGSTEARPLEWISFCNNYFNGTIPESLNLSNLYYLDLGRNNLTGSIPLDWVEGGMSSIRTLYVDYNSLSGELPAELLNGLGNGGMEQLVLNDNQFTGEFPVPSSSSSRLRILEIHNNGFDKMKRDICQLSIVESETGTMSIFKADCTICVCELFCETGRCIE